MKYTFKSPPKLRTRGNMVKWSQKVPSSNPLLPIKKGGLGMIKLPVKWRLRRAILKGSPKD